MSVKVALIRQLINETITRKFVIFTLLNYTAIFIFTYVQQNLMTSSAYFNLNSINHKLYVLHRLF